MSVCCVREVKRKVGPDSNLVHKKADIALHGNPTSQLRDVTCHMGSHRINLLRDTSERAPPNPNHAGWCSIYLPRRDGRLSWPSWLNSAPARSRTTDLSITSPMPNRTAAPPNDNRNQSCQSYTKVLVFSRSYCCTWESVFIVMILSFVYLSFRLYSGAQCRHRGLKVVSSCA